MSSDSSPSSDSSAINVDAFLRTLLRPVIFWGVTVGVVAASGQPGVVCITPLAWLLALWCGVRYVQLSDGFPGRWGPALLGAALGLVMGILFVVVIGRLPVQPDEVSKMQAITAFMVVGSIIVCTGLSVIAARVALRNYAGD
jgi:hypothetical protein